jgi:predicted DNA-binding transcriptional regulator AlpA
MKKPEKFLDLRQISVFTGKSYRTIKRWKSQGILPPPAVHGKNRRSEWTAIQIRRWWLRLGRKGANRGQLEEYDQ